MTRKPPAGVKHARCIDHVPHAYTSTGWLCVTTPEPGRAAAMVEFADYLTAVRDAHTAAERARPIPDPSTDPYFTGETRTDPDGRPVGLPVCRSAERCQPYLLHVHAGAPGGANGIYTSTGAYATAEQLAPAPSVEPGRIALDSAPVDPLTAAMAEFVADGVAIGALDAETVTADGLAAAIIDDQSEDDDPSTAADEIAAERSATFERTTRIGRRVARARKSRAPMGQYAPESVPVVEPSPSIAERAAADTAAAGDRGYYARVAAYQEQHRADLRAYLNETTPASERETVDPLDAYRAVAESAVIESDPVADDEPSPALVVAEPSGRPVCPRCRQVFRKSGSGLAWHLANRPDCAGRAPGLVAVPDSTPLGQHIAALTA